MLVGKSPLISEQRRAATSMQKYHGFVAAETASPDHADQAGHGLAGIDRIEQDALGPGQQPDRLDHLRRRQAVAGADVTVIHPDRLAAYRVGVAQQFRGKGGGHYGDIRYGCHGTEKAGQSLPSRACR